MNVLERIAEQLLAELELADSVDRQADYYTLKQRKLQLILDALDRAGRFTPTTLHPPELQRCDYCMEFYPAPVHLHHSEEECQAQQDAITLANSTTHLI